MPPCRGGVCSLFGGLGRDRNRQWCDRAPCSQATGRSAVNLRRDRPGSEGMARVICVTHRPDAEDGWTDTGPRHWRYGQMNRHLTTSAEPRDGQEHTTLDLDRDLLRDAAEALGTTRTTDTVHAALRDVVARRRRAWLARREISPSWKSPCPNCGPLESKRSSKPESPTPRRWTPRPGSRNSLTRPSGAQRKARAGIVWGGGGWRDRRLRSGRDGVAMERSVPCPRAQYGADFGSDPRRVRFQR